MPIDDIKDLFRQRALDCRGPFPWSIPIDGINDNEANGPGVYLIALKEHRDKALVSDDAIRKWVTIAHEMHLKGNTRPENAENNEEFRDSIGKYVESFWVPGEKILYIGMTKSHEGGIRSRVLSGYYTELGLSRPHHGGYFLKTIDDWKDLLVYWAPVASGTAHYEEEKLLDLFKDSNEKRMYPFANRKERIKRLLKTSV